MIDLASMRVLKYLTRDSSSGQNLEHLSKHREKGLWSFLTWSFFISQVLGAEQLLGAPASASQTPDDHAASANAGEGQGAPGELSAQGTVAQADTGLPGQTFATYPVAAAGEALPIMLAGVPVDASMAAALGLHEEPSTQSSLYNGGTASALDSGPALPGTGGHDGTPHLPDPGGIIDVLDPILDPILDHLPPVIGAVGDVLDPILDLVPPVLGAVGNVIATVADVVTPVVATVGQVLAPVTGIVGDVTHALDPLLEKVTTPVAELVADAAAPLEPVLGVVTDLAGPVTSLLGLGGSHDAHAGSSPIALTSSSLDLEHTLSPGGLLNDLFSGGRYTDYNLALQSHDATAATGATHAPAGSGSVLSLIDHLVSSTGESHDAQGDHAHQQAFSLPSVLDDMASRGLGDGISG